MCVGLRAAQPHHELRQLVRAYVQRVRDPRAVPIMEFVYQGATSKTTISRMLDNSPSPRGARNTLKRHYPRDEINPQGILRTACKVGISVTCSANSSCGS